MTNVFHFSLNGSKKHRSVRCISARKRWQNARKQFARIVSILDCTGCTQRTSFVHQSWKAKFFVFLKCIVQLAICSKVSECVEPTRSFTTRKCISGKRLQCNANIIYFFRDARMSCSPCKSFCFSFSARTKDHLVGECSAVQCSGGEAKQQRQSARKNVAFTAQP